jgi:lipopolysaccharide export system permease protein
VRLRPAFTTLDRYLLKQVAGTFVSVFAIVISLMIFEHFPRLLDVVSLSGRKTYVVVQSMMALLPEYAGLGLLFGLYLAIALTVRRLSLRGELDIVQASGISTYRWMRFPAVLTIVIAGLMLWNQGWLMPAGERRLSELGQRLEGGQFGYDLKAGEFTDLGRGITLRFADVDPGTGELRGVFFHTAHTTFTASRGRLGFNFTNHVLIDLEQGRALNGSNGQSLSFNAFRFDSGEHVGDKDKPVDITERRKGMRLPALLSSDDSGDFALACSRLLWPAFTLMVPFLAAALGKPMRRSSSALGLMSGIVLLVMFTRSTSFVAATGSGHPGLVALAIAAIWMAVVSVIVWGERRWGEGHIDQWLVKGTRRVGLGRLRGSLRRRVVSFG